jgi:aspartyl-tRNA synthetase
MISSQIYFNLVWDVRKSAKVAAFPKAASAQDLLVDSPGAVDVSQLDELGIKIVE